MPDELPKDSVPDSDRIDRWLAGELMGEEAEAVERYFEANPPCEEPLGGEVVPVIAGPERRDVAALIAKIKTDSLGGRPGQGVGS